MAGTAPQRHVVLGRVHGLFGVRGWVKVYSYTRPAEAILGYERWWIGNAGERRDYRVLEARVQGKTLVARLADADDEPLPDRDAALELLDLDIAVERGDLPEPEPGEYYWFDLIGLNVVTVDGHDLGRVTAMMETGANDVLVVRGDRERLIPLVIEQFVTAVDLEGGTIHVDWDPDF
ncbi:ribosome maturation factor RimM [Salinisphaera sp.]|uniref:ribosome maturation factor RimM n=1 Tax=Salinisphaera sp. TaxID=1914330 RepID=UPI002D782BCD|nr:ribosome maturation factor RimM [Salinisphaera sp.]HET7312824.1 ribosome maturation factor RimM [Salinisphaera sp.]